MARKTGPEEGYNIVELIIVMVVLGLAALLGLPALKNQIVRSRFVSTLQNVKTQILIARQEAARLGFEVVVRPQFGQNQLLIFANVDEDAGYTFSPDPTKPYRTVDYELTTIKLPSDFEFGGAPTAPKAKDRRRVNGLTKPTTGGPKVAVFLRNGSIETPGAFRIRDADHKNVFEVRIEPRASARVFLQKFHPNPPWGGSAAYFPRGRHEGSNAPLWQWQ